MTRFVIIGDAHFQSTHSRNAERIRAIEQITEEGLALPDLGAWIWLGDTFDTRSTADDRNLVAGILQRQAAVAPVLDIYGNHCVPMDKDIFSKLSAKHPIVVVASPQTVRLATPAGQHVSIFCVPFPHKSKMVALGVQHQQLGDVARGALDVICMKGADDLEEARRRGDMTLVIGHATLTGSVTSVGQPMGIDGDIAIDAAMLARFGDVPKLFGHIHKPQELLGAYYAGSIAAKDYGETERKRWLLVTFGQGDEMREGATDADGWLYDIESRPIHTAPLYHVEGELTRDGFAWAVKKGPSGPDDDVPLSWEGADVRVRYRFNAHEKSALDEALVRAPFAGAKRLELDPIAVRERAARAPEVAQAVTLEAKVSAFVRQSGLSWTAGMETKLAALQEADGAAFLTRLQSDLSASRPPILEAGDHPDRELASHAAGRADADNSRTVDVLDLNAVYPVRKVEVTR